MKTISLFLSAFGDLFTRYMPRIKKRECFAFLVHPRDISDVYRKYPFLKYLPLNVTNHLTRYMWPVTVSKVCGLVSKETEKRIDGYVIGITMTANQMLENRNYAVKKIINAIKLAEKKGATIVGLGGLSSPLVNGGIDVVGKYNVFITNGNALTVGISVLGILEIAKKRNVSLSRDTLAIVGATGSIGSALSKLLVMDHGVKNLILIGRTFSNIKKLKKELINVGDNIIVTESTKIFDIKFADLVIVATSSNGTLIDANHLKKNSIIYDITQPSNVSKDIKYKREDVLIIDGAITALPSNINIFSNFGLQNKTSFACFAETLILAAEGSNADFCVGSVKLEQVKYILTLAKEYGVKLAPLTSYGNSIE